MHDGGGGQQDMPVIGSGHCRRSAQRVVLTRLPFYPLSSELSVHSGGGGETYFNITLHPHTHHPSPDPPTTHASPFHLAMPHHFA